MKKPPRSPARRKSTATVQAASPRAPTYDDLLAIARLIESGSRFSEFRLRSGDIEVEVKRANGAALPTTLPPPPPKGGGESFAQRGGEPASLLPIKAASASEIPDLPAGTHLIRSPMVGTFYSAPEPGAKPFVEAGMRVKSDSIVCIIEVMKLMNSITAGVAGVVTHVFVENAATVEPGQALAAVRPGR